MFNSVSII